MFVDASYERNTRSYLRQKQEDKVRALTLGEVSREIHCMKTEISALKTRISELEKGKQVQASPVSTPTYSGRKVNYTLHNTPRITEEVEVPEGHPDPHMGIRDMHLLAIQYQQHHIKIKVWIKGKMFDLITLLDYGSDVNMFSKKAIPSQY